MIKQLAFALACIGFFFSSNLVTAQETQDTTTEEESSTQPFEGVTPIENTEPVPSTNPDLSIEIKEETPKKKKKSKIRYKEDDGFLLRFNKRNYLRLDARAQFAVTNDQDLVAPQNISLVPHQLRPSLRGKFAKRFGFKIAADFAILVNESNDIGDNDPEKALKDAWVSLGIGKNFLVRAGHFKSSFGRQTLYSSSALLLPNRAQADGKFTFERGIGAMIEGESKKERFQYRAGLSTDVQTAAIEQLEAVPVLTARMVLNPNGPLKADEGPLKTGKKTRTSFGVNVAVPLAGEADTVNDTGNLSVGADAAIEIGRLSGQVEAFSRLRLVEIEVNNVAIANGEIFFQQGAYGQLGFLVIPKRVQVGARVGFVSEDFDLNENLNTQGARTEFSFGTNLFILERRLMAQALFSQFFEVNDDPTSIFLLQLQGAL